MVVVEVVVVVVVASAAEVVVVEDVVLGDSDVSGSSAGAEEAVEVVVVADVVLVLDVEAVGATVISGSDVSSAPGSGGKLCASAAASAASVFVVAVSGCVITAVTAPAAVVAGLLSLPPGEQAAASKPAASAMANRNFAFICVAYRREAGRTENIIAEKVVSVPSPTTTATCPSHPAAKMPV